MQPNRDSIELANGSKHSSASNSKIDLNNNTEKNLNETFFNQDNKKIKLYEKFPLLTDTSKINQSKANQANVIYDNDSLINEIDYYSAFPFVDETSIHSAVISTPIISKKSSLKNQNLIYSFKIDSPIKKNKNDEYIKNFKPLANGDLNACVSIPVEQNELNDHHINRHHHHHNHHHVKSNLNKQSNRFFLI